MEKLTDNIIELNRDVEPLIIQGTATRTIFFEKKFGDKFKPLQFIHCSDVHARIEMWNRILEYVNYYSEYIEFIIHTGDYCWSHQQEYHDLYNTGIKCKRPIYPCVGNHDTYKVSSWELNTKESTHKLVFEPFDCSDLQFMNCDFSMTYYKDFPESNIRIIVLDIYYDIEKQCEWLKNILEDSFNKGFCVITAMHQPSGNVNDSFGVTFHTKDDYESLCGKNRQHPFEPVIAEFISRGGCHICNLVGDVHHDLFGFTDAGVLNTAVPSATCWDGWCDGKKVQGTRTFDCFNAVSVDTNLSLLKIARVGNNRDHYFRSQRSLCYDYKNKKIIYND